MPLLPCTANCAASATRRSSFTVIVPPTSQNQGQVEADLRDMLPGILNRGDEEVRHRCEHLIRNYDPCISCATHFLRLEIERE